MHKLQTFVFATLNSNKLHEIQSLTSNYDVVIRPAQDFVNQLPEETGTSFYENAAIKAKYLGEHSKLPSLADDSGLCINALNGQPGIYSARWAGPNKDYSAAIAKIYQLLKDTNDYSAKFICVLALFLPQTEELLYFHGAVEGSIIYPPYGNKGFAYDAIFVPHGYNLTFAAMDSSLKNSISHRSQAFNLFAQQCLVKI